MARGETDERIRRALGRSAIVRHERLSRLVESRTRNRGNRLMRYVVVSITLAFILLSSVTASQRSAAPGAAAVSGDPHRALLDQYCVTCHNQRAKTAGLTLDAMDLAQVPKNAETWE